MNIISEFESKLKNVWWEKVYSAREIMKVFWYDKWERFYWAISRAKDDLNNQSKINQNFFFVTNKETWWRPKEDVLLTLWWCYLVLKKCDERKENVKLLIAYIDGIIRENKPKKNKIKKVSFDKIFLFLVIIISISTVWYYVKSYISFTNSQNKNIYEDIMVANNTNNENQTNIQTWEIIEEQQKNEEVNLEEPKTEENINEEKIIGFQDLFNNYIKSWWEKVFDIWKNVNYRNNFTKTITWENLVYSYFTLWNNGFFRDSCSLLSKKDCLSASKSDLSSFANFWDKTKYGYEILDLYKVNWNFDNKNVYCVKYKYKLRYDTSDNFITETFNYTTDIIDWVEEINWRFCEKIEKGWKKVKCPFELDNYYCN